MSDQTTETPMEQSTQCESWNPSVAAKKVMWFAGKILAALLTALIMSPKAQALLNFAGVHLTLIQSQVIAATIAGSFIEAIHDLLKVKTGWKFL